MQLNALINDLDQLNYYWNDLEDRHFYELAKVYSDRELIYLVDVFLRGISNKHRVPGSVVDCLWGMRKWHNDHLDLTHKQKIYIVANIIQYWDQINLDMRLALGL